MAVKDIAGVQVELDDEGFMTNPDQWNEDIAKALAAEEGISELTDKHWEVQLFRKFYVIEFHHPKKSQGVHESEQRIIESYHSLPLIFDYWLTG